MDDTKQPLADMFKLLSREEHLLTHQIAEERDAGERLKMSHDLQNVKMLLSEIAEKLLISTYPPHQQRVISLTHATQLSLLR